MKHKDKLKLARKMMSRQERKDRISPFLSKAWGDRNTAIKKRVDKVIAKIKALKDEKNRQENKGVAGSIETICGVIHWKTI